MKLHYKGKYDLNPDSLPYSEHKNNAVQFREANDSKTLGIVANVAAAVIIIVMAIPAFKRSWDYNGTMSITSLRFFLGCLMSTLVIFPHELLHAICFKEDVYLYTNLKHGMLFVIGTETMSKSRFVFMSLLPNLVFGIIPYIIGMIFPQCIFLLTCGTLVTGIGAGDYYNVFNALTQMPKGARAYMHKFHSFWYMPDEQ